MSAIAYCLAYQHNLWLVLLAGALCFLSNLGSMLFLRAAGRSISYQRWTWLCVMGFAGGFGIWSTHFVAMLAYDPGIVVGYDRDLTLLSLAVAFASTFTAGAVILVLPRRQGTIAAGLIFGFGVASMHFVGMAGMEVPGELVWNRNLVISSLTISWIAATIGFSISNTIVLSDKRIVTAASFLSLGIVLMHFTAMGALTLSPGINPVAHQGLSKSFLLIMIMLVSLSFLASGISAVTIAVRAARKALASEANFDVLVRGVTDYAIYMLDPTGVVTNWNAGAERFKGYKASEIIGSNFSIFYSQEDQKNGLPEHALHLARKNGRFEAEGLRYRKNGSSFYANVLIQPVYDDKGHQLGFAKITRDITEQKADRDRIVAVTRNLDLALENMIQGICLFDANEKLILSNQRYRSLFSFDDEFLKPGVSYWEIVRRGYEIALPDDPDFEERARAHYRKHIEAIRSGQNSLIHKMDGDHSILANFNLVADGGWVATFEDITDRIRSEEHIAFLAKHDSLTKLPNRSALNDFLDYEVAFATRNNGHVAVIGVDLNKFKMINDQIGHHVGDKVLVELATRLSKLLKQNEMVARVGGDEFAAIKRYTDISEVQDFAERLSEALSIPVTLDHHKLTTGASIGVALFPEDGDAPDVLLANADLAMYRSKNSLTQKICFYDGNMDELARDRAKLAKDLWLGIENNEFHLHYQVQKSVLTGCITGYEVLLRWHHPERGNVSPVDFIGVAEECGAILPIGEWVLRQACHEAASWPNDLKVAVNLSPVQIAHADTVSLVISVLKETGLDPRRLELEITENSIIVDKQRAMNALNLIKALGVSIAIDDFGTGYSSLELLRSFPFDKIKLDRSFMVELQESDEARAMVRAILSLGQGLRIPVLAEGVETNEQLDILRTEGCQEAQGYLLGRPMPMAQQALAQVA
ncbi:bifunctional diguanylate cyclase/phosphodiesterase [Agrobacterium larrymoorei]|uniref:EAL domain-containing protein n=1 Tax=Agrobacterium larrymoorei TaxID=160699 RepID=A0AAF0KH67_9HYPH|nr:EAL domain-containing protein [Agrobacterium larrymoorei]WHA44142.1 EAL domain-containing protein [Agrobacterium larrymoorei]